MAITPFQRIHHYVAGKDTCVSNVLREHFRLADDKIDELIGLGAIYRNKKRVLIDEELPKGTYLRLHLKPKRFDVSGIQWKERIVESNPEYLVVNKPAGIPTHATLDNQEENVLTQIRYVVEDEVYVTQRLDVPVAGLLVLAKTSPFQVRFNRWLSEKRVIKRYRALVEKAPELGKHLHYMEPSERSPKRVGLDQKPGWLPCELSVTKVEPIRFLDKDLFELEIELHTGRTHQIRAQLAAMGSPILGDGLYHSKIHLPRQLIALMSSYIEWPGKKPVTLNAREHFETNLI